uniref:co-chaperone GroES n=1 Tax=Ndongobacter massiliensis TaxID=1871025 RepID=UPI000931E8F6|nr:co-chaperone GroES [Ndongobacter massiliensis]
MRLSPLGERIVIRKLEKEEKTSSGIVLPTSAQEQPQYAEVVAISDKVEKDEELKGSVKVGDRVIYSKYAGTEVKLDGEEFIVIKLEDVLAVVAE